MAAKQSAGLMMFRRRAGAIEVLLGHPGGPFWHGRHEGAWTIPKGGIHQGERASACAVREFKEETGFDPQGPFLALGQVVLRSGKIVHAWAFEGDVDPATLVSMTTTVQWPPRSGRELTIPEIDKVQFFSIEAARAVINPPQAPLLDRLVKALGDSAAAPAQPR